MQGTIAHTGSKQCKGGLHTQAANDAREDCLHRQRTMQKRIAHTGSERCKGESHTQAAKDAREDCTQVEPRQKILE